MKKISLLLMLSLFFLACKKENPTPIEDEVAKVTADFSYHVSTTTPGKVTFTNLSEGADYSEWVFGDGGTSPLTNPTHTYTENGTYTVKLTGNNYSGGKNSTTKLVTISNIDNTPLPTTGQLIFWVSTSDYGEINIKVNGGNVGNITVYSTSGLGPDCGTVGFVTIERPAGLYTVTATSASGATWSFQSQIVNGECKKMQLT